MANMLSEVPADVERSKRACRYTFLPVGVRERCTIHNNIVKMMKVMLNGNWHLVTAPNYFKIKI